MVGRAQAERARVALGSARSGIRTPAGRGFAMIAVATATTGFAMAAQQNVVSNFYEGELGFGGPQFGYITAIREVPGFLLIILTALFYRLSLPHLTAGAFLVLAVGYSMFGFADSFWTVAPWVVLSSMGYHTWLQTQPALGMSLTTENRSGEVLGKLAAIRQGGALVAMAVMLLAFRFGWLDFRAAFILFGAMALVAAVAIVRFPQLHNGEEQREAPQRERLVFRREYRLYYWLSLLDGARMQIFFSFGLWVLVDHFALDVPAISAVLLIVAFGAMVLGPWIGRQIDFHGERRILGFINIGYMVVLAGFALIDYVWVALFCYVLYSFIYPFSRMGAATYLRKIAPANDVAPSLAMGLTMQHATALVVPVATGFVLNYAGYQIPFLVAIGIATVTLVLTRRLDPANQKSSLRLREEAALAGR